MSATTRVRRKTITAIRAMKGQRKIVCLTAYTTPMARMLDAHCDLLLVGDSLGMVLYGLETTVSVTLDMMIAHGQAVMRGASQACVIVDMPFGSYQESKEQAYRNAVRILQETGCDGIKLEGGAELAETIQFLSSRGVPVLAHVGLMPQMVNTSGGFRALGHSDEEAAKIVADADAVAAAGAFAVVIEGTVEPVARSISQSLAIPTIGIGASVACDGQVLVCDDMLGLFDAFKPRFVKRYAELGALVSQAAADYAREVREGVFPAEEHTFMPRRKQD